KYAAELAERLIECGLCQNRTGCAGGQSTRGQDDQSGQGQDDEGIDEHADHSNNALILRLLNLCQCVCVRSGTHTSLIREQAACNAVAHCLLDGHTCDTACQRLRLECADEDGLDRLNQCRVVDDQNHDAAED